MLMKNCMSTPTTAAQRKTRPTVDAMYGYREMLGDMVVQYLGA